MSYRVISSLFLLAAFATSILAQSPDYRPPPPPTKGVGLEVRFRYMLPPDISFSGFGNIPMNEYQVDSTDPILGKTREVAYDDGYLRQDYIEADLVGGGGENAERRVSPNKDATSNFGYLNESQVNPEDPTELIFHRYGSAADPDVEFSANTSNGMGWEINYTKYINRARNMGIQVGFSTNGFDSRFNDSISADLYVKEFRHQMAGGVNVPDMPPKKGEGDDAVQPPYVGDVVREEVDSGNLLEWAAEQSEETILEGATVDTKADIRSSLYNFRAGPTYAMNVGNHFGVQLGAGVSAIYYSGQFSAYEILNNPVGVDGPSRGMTTTEDAEWQVGGYVDASAYYKFTDRVSLFSGAQVQSGSTYKQANEERYANVDFSAQIYVHAGVGIRF